MIGPTKLEPEAEAEEKGERRVELSVDEHVNEEEDDTISRARSEGTCAAWRKDEIPGEGKYIGHQDPEKSEASHCVEVRQPGGDLGGGKLRQLRVLCSRTWPRSA